MRQSRLGPTYIDDTIEELRGWAAFQEEKKRTSAAARLRPAPGVRPADLAAVLHTTAASKPPVRRVGRNDPCPCGSGKKYKKCCGGGGA